VPDPAFVAALHDPRAYPHDCGDVRLLETHISWVFLTGEYAYKLKKPVDFGFLDFSTLSKRRYYCEEECRCNSVFAPEIYCGVVSVVKDIDGRFHIGGDGEIVEYAVKMRQFDTENQLDHLLERGRLTGQMLRRFAKDIAAIYRDLPEIADALKPTREDRILHPLCENFRSLMAAQAAQDYHAILARLRTWSIAMYEQMRDQFADRVHEGWIRERHGDLHLSNLVLTDNGIRAFDCIEFSEQLRQIDAVDDIAFLFMDCAVRGHEDLAYTFVDGYLEATGDYSGAPLLRFYAIYRSLVRAKVAALQLAQSFDDGAAKRLDRHIDWARKIVNLPAGHIVLMCGPSGSGKSWLAERLVPYIPGIRIRSDIVRRQLAGLDRTQASGSDLDSGIYKQAMGEAVYARLLELTGDLIAVGENVVVDAAFLSSANRATFQAFARKQGCKCVVVQCDAQPDVLRQRVVLRLASGDDPSEATLAVLDRQLESFDLPGPDEQTIRVRTDHDVDIQHIITQLNAPAAPPTDDQQPRIMP
jgi:aminoglycoside phosphotransferase family enzyme/predicted kinase